MFTIKDTFAIVYSAVRSRAARCLAFSLAGFLACAQSAPVVVGYYLGSSATTYPVNNLVTNGSVAHLTHLNYAFADIVASSSGYSCALHNTASEAGPSGIFQQLKQLKTANPNLKILISIGGALGSGNFQTASGPQYMNSLAASCVNLFIGGQFATSTATTPGLFDGIDIDWEFPAKNSAKQPNLQYAQLMASFRQHLDSYATLHNPKTHYVLTSAISPNNGSDWQAQDILLTNGDPNSATTYVDFFNVMTYDYAGSWDTAVTSTAPLSSIEGNIADLISQGAPAGKLALGIPFYGVDYLGKFTGDTSGTPLSTLLSQSNTAPVQGGSPLATVDTAYADILQQTLSKVNVTVQHDSYGSAWALDPAKQLLWVYDDANTIQTKAAWAKSQSLAGIMTWDVTKDTVSGTLLCAMEAAASGSVCVSSQPPPPLFDFEGGVSGWTNTGQVYSIAASSLVAYTGHNSMAVNFNSLAWPKTPGTVWIAPPAAIKAGSTVSFEVYLPSNSATVTNLTDIQAFFMDAKWTWTSLTVNASSLKANAWNQVSVTVPLNAVPTFTEIGLQFDSPAAWTGTIYVDSVTVH